MNLIERDYYLDQLPQLLCTATTGHGRVVLISGEAGVGKTALVERIVCQYDSQIRWLWGVYEALFTLRPLGLLYDITTQVEGRLSRHMEGDIEQGSAFTAFLDDLQESPLPCIVTFEDVYWADEATLDLIKFPGRRVPHLPVLFLVAYRDPELSRSRPLGMVPGDLTDEAVIKLKLAPCPGKRSAHWRGWLSAQPKDSMLPRLVTPSLSPKCLPARPKVSQSIDGLAELLQIKISRKEYVL